MQQGGEVHAVKTGRRSGGGRGGGGDEGVVGGIVAAALLPERVPAAGGGGFHDAEAAVAGVPEQAGEGDLRAEAAVARGGQRGPAAAVVEPHAAGLLGRMAAGCGGIQDGVRRESAGISTTGQEKGPQGDGGGIRQQGVGAVLEFLKIGEAVLVGISRGIGAGQGREVEVFPGIAHAVRVAVQARRQPGTGAEADVVERDIKGIAEGGVGVVAEDQAAVGPCLIIGRAVEGRETDIITEDMISRVGRVVGHTEDVEVPVEVVMGDVEAFPAEVLGAVAMDLDDDPLAPGAEPEDEAVGVRVAFQAGLEGPRAGGEGAPAGIRPFEPAAVGRGVDDAEVGGFGQALGEFVELRPAVDIGAAVPDFVAFEAGVEGGGRLLQMGWRGFDGEGRLDHAERRGDAVADVGLSGGVRVDGIVGHRRGGEAGIGIDDPQRRGGGGCVLRGGQRGELGVDRVHGVAHRLGLVGVEQVVEEDPHVRVRGAELVDEGAEVGDHLVGGEVVVAEVVDADHHRDGVRDVGRAGIAGAGGGQVGVGDAEVGTADVIGLRLGLAGPVEQRAFAAVVRAAVGGEADAGVDPRRAPAVVAVVHVFEGLAVDVRGGQQRRRLRAGDRAGELVAEERIDRHSLFGEPLEDTVAVAWVVAVAALGDRVTDEDQLAVAACHGAVGEEGLGVALADPQLGGLVEMQAVGDLGLEVEVREEVDIRRGGGERFMAGADGVAGGPGGGDPADDGFHVRGVGQVGAQVVDQFLEAGAG